MPTNVNRILEEFGFNITDGRFPQKYLTQAKSQLLKHLIEELPKENRLPLELKDLSLEIHRKEQSLTPLLNEVKNACLAKVREMLRRVLR